MKLMKIYYDPEAPAGQAPVEPVVVTPAADETPKNKEGWERLAKENPSRWIELTQPRMDQAVRESRETKELLERERQEKANLSAELERYRKPAVVIPEGQKYNLNSLPKNQDEWDQLFLESPTFASDLRNAAFTKQNADEISFKRAWTTSAQEVQAVHPELYVAEVGSDGQALKDGQGKPVLKRDQGGNLIFNPNSEKGKLWLQIWNESQRPDGTNPLSSTPNAPRLMKAALEQRLYERGQAMISNQAPEVKQNQVAPQGVPPPKNQVKVVFTSTDEQVRAERAVQNGVYKSLEEFCQIRDNGIQPVYDENRRPDFSKR